MGFLRKLEKSIRPVAKSIAPVVGSIVGNYFGGPLGALMGGGIGGGLSSKSHRFEHALGGTGVGLGYSFLAPMFARGMGLSADGLMGRAMGAQHPGIMDQLMQLMGPSAYMGSSSSNDNKQRGVQHPFGGKMDMKEVPSLMASLGLTNSDLINTALGATSIIGQLGARAKYPKNMHEIMEQSKPKWGPEHQPRQLKPYQRQYIQPTPEYKAGYEAEHQFLTPLPQEYARGGYVHGDSGGQDDDVPRNLRPDTYVMDATTTSLQGDGNSLKGKKDFEEMERKLIRTGIVKGLLPKARVLTGKKERPIKAVVSSGEFEFSPEAVTVLGNGSGAKGAKKFDTYRKNLRKQKGVKKFLPPKSKKLTSYMR